MHHPDVCIVGAGIIGLSLALELEHRGAQVTVLERDTPLSHASQAAAGMLAAYDPDNPPELFPLAELSLSLYPAFLARIEHLSGQSVPFQTTQTYQSVQDANAQPAILPPEVAAGPHSFTLLHEHSLDPRQLAPALEAAVRATTIRILTQTALRTVVDRANTLHLDTTKGLIATTHLVHTQGAWSLPPVTPRKGQMLAVRIQPTLALDYVLRTPEIYIVPRMTGPRAGQAVIGATVEDAGFNTQTDAASIAHLRTLATRLLPALAEAPTTDQWAGLRPHTPSHLPLLGQLTPNQFLASGHYRNGILLAPATALLLAQLLASGPTRIDLTPFAPPEMEQPSSGPLHRYSPISNDKPLSPAL